MNLTIKDLAISKELSLEERAAVRGGVSDLGLVNNQGNVQVVNLATTGPVVKGDGNLVMHDVTVDQTASNTATNTNAYGVSIYPYWW